MGNVLGRVDIRRSATGLEFTADGGVTWTAVGSGTAMEDVLATNSAGDVQDFDVTGFDSENDGNYEIYGDLIYKGGVGAVSLTLQPIVAGSGVSTNQHAHGTSTAGGSAPTALSDTSLFIGGENDAGDQHLLFNIKMTSKSGRIRVVYTQFRRSQSAVTVTYQTISRWTDTASAFTGLRFHSSVAASLRNASFVMVRKLKMTL